MALTGLRRVLGSYQRFRAAQPLIADSLTAGAHPTPRDPACTLLTWFPLGAGALFFAGDVLCQTIEKKKEDPYDLKRYRTMRCDALHCACVNVCVMRDSPASIHS